MTALATLNPIPQYFGLDGAPLDGGELFFGAVGGNPETAPITVYWDAAATQPAAQPIRTAHGYPMRGGTPAIVYTAAAYSIMVRDSAGRQVLYAPDSADFGNASTLSASITALGASITALSDASGSSLIGHISTGTGSVARTVQSKLRDVVCVLDFGADPTGAADSTAAFNAALLAGKRVYAPAGTYKLVSTVSMQQDGNLLFGDANATLLKYTGAAVAIDFNGKQHVALRDLRLQAPGATIGVSVDGSSAACHWFRVENVTINGSSTGSDTSGTVSTGTGIKVQRSFYGVISGCDIAFWNKGLYGLNSFNGNEVFANAFRQNLTGIRVTDETTNSEGAKIFGNTVESAQASTAYGIDIQGGSSHDVSGNSVEISTGTGVGLYVHKGVIAAKGHAFCRNQFVGTDPSVKIGANSGVNSTWAIKYEGARCNGSVTIGVDADYTTVVVDRRDLLDGTGNVTNSSTTTRLTYSDDQSFTVGITGLTTSPTVSWKYQIANNIVTVFAQTLNGTSNSTACTITGLPTIIRPINTQTVWCLVQDSGSYFASRGYVDSSGVITLAKDSSGAIFTNTGSKGFIGSTLTYPLN